MSGLPLVLILPLALQVGSTAWAQEVFAGAGRLHPVNARTSTYSWQIGYYQPFTEDWGASFTWLNEGHLPDHHRDGAAIQAWRRHRMERNDLVLAAGLGPYRTFDTIPAGNAQGYRNRHGLGILWSLRASYPLATPHLSAFLQLNRVSGTPAPQSQAAVVGVALRLDHPAAAPAQSPSAASEEPNNELAFLFGRTILNSFESETSDVLATYIVEYRRRVAPHLDLSFGYTDEGGIDSARRDGLAATVWASTRPGRWLLAAGIGSYLYRVFPDPDRARTGEGAHIRGCPRYSMTAGLRLDGHWGGRFQWHRTATRDHRDTDALLAGLAYAW